MNQRHGNLIQMMLDGEFDVLVHGANCMCTMGAGFADQVRRAFPEAYAADRSTRRGDPAKLGRYTAAEVVRGQQRFTVVNAYTQYDWRGAGEKLNYDAMRAAMTSVGRDFRGQRIAYPLIGAGLARGKWPLIASLIEDALAGEDHTLVIYQSAGPHRRPASPTPS